MDIVSGLLAVVAILLVGLWWSTRHMYKLGDQIPGPKPLPLIGNFLSIAGDVKYVFKTVSKLLKKYGNTLRIYVGPILIVVLANHDDIETIIGTSKFNTRSELFMHYLKPVMGEGLLTASGELWRRHRKIIQPTFNVKVLETFIGTFNKNAQILVNSLESHANNTTFDLWPSVYLFSVDTVYESIFGVSFNVQINKENELVTASQQGMKTLMKRMSNPLLYFDWVFKRSELGKEQNTLLKILYGFEPKIRAQQLEKQHAKMLEKDPVDDDLTKVRCLPFLDLMIQASEAGQEILSPTELKNEAIILGFGGVETTASTNCFALVLLSLHPEYQQQVAQELQDILGDDPNRPITASDLNDLKYLERVIKETLRLFPAVAIGPRSITEDVKLSACTLPAGAIAVVSYFTMMRDPELYPDPLKFDPDRFLPEAIAQRPSNSYIPFGMGPRICVGFKYAMLQMKTVLAHVLRRYEVLPACTRKDIEHVETGIVLKPVRGFRIKLRPRSSTMQQ